MVVRKLCQLGGLLFLGSTAFIIASLLSYSPKDPNWNYYVSDVEHWYNWGGVWGASVADWGLQLLGSALLLLIILGLLGSWSLFSLRPRWAMQIFWRGMFLLFAASMLLALLCVDDPLFRVIAFPGGLLGYYITDLLSPLSLEGAYGIAGGIIALAVLTGLPVRRWRQQAQHRFTAVHGMLRQYQQWPARKTVEGYEEEPPPGNFEATKENLATTQEEPLVRTLPRVSIPPAWEAHLAVAVDAPKPKPASSAPEEPSGGGALRSSSPKNL